MDWICLPQIRGYLPAVVNAVMNMFVFYFWRNSSQWATASSFTRFLDHTQRRTTVGRTPLDEWSACRRDLYLTTLNTHNRQTSMSPVGFEPTIPAGELPQTYALDRAATGTGNEHVVSVQIMPFFMQGVFVLLIQDDRRRCCCVWWM